MQILMAAPDRDLLECYRQLLQNDFGPVQTAFDGTQVLERIRTEAPDVVLLDEEIPRIDFGTLAGRIRGEGIALIALTKKRNEEARRAPANAWLTYPFSPEDMAGIIKQTAGAAETAGTSKQNDGGAETAGKGEMR